MNAHTATPDAQIALLTVGCALAAALLVGLLHWGLTRHKRGVAAEHAAMQHVDKDARADTSTLTAGVRERAQTQRVFLLLSFLLFSFLFFSFLFSSLLFFSLLFSSFLFFYFSQSRRRH